MTQLAGSLFAFLSGLVGQAIALAQQSFWWIVVIAVLTKVVDSYVLEAYTPIPSGWIRLALSFVIVMFLSFVWVGLLQGLVPSA